MWSIFSRKSTEKSSQYQTATFKIIGMHCTSCSMNIDGELEDTTGVISASTSYAKSETKVVFDPKKIQPKKIQQVIGGLNYEVELA